MLVGGAVVDCAHRHWVVGVAGAQADFRNRQAAGAVAQVEQLFQIAVGVIDAQAGVAGVGPGQGDVGPHQNRHRFTDIGVAESSDTGNAVADVGAGEAALEGAVAVVDVDASVGGVADQQLIFAVEPGHAAGGVQLSGQSAWVAPVFIVGHGADTGGDRTTQQ